jgi:hypothetical protein
MSLESEYLSFDKIGSKNDLGRKLAASAPCDRKAHQTSRNKKK